MNERLSESAVATILENAPKVIAAIDAMLAQVDTSSHKCECCKLTIKHQYRDSQFGDNLRSWREKVARWMREAKNEIYLKEGK